MTKKFELPKIIADEFNLIEEALQKLILKFHVHLSANEWHETEKILTGLILFKSYISKHLEKQTVKQ